MFHQITLQYKKHHRSHSDPQQNKSESKPIGNKPSPLKLPEIGKFGGHNSSLREEDVPALFQKGVTKIVDAINAYLDGECNVKGRLHLPLNNTLSISYVRDAMVEDLGCHLTRKEVIAINRKLRGDVSSAAVVQSEVDDIVSGKDFMKLYVRLARSVAKRRGASGSDMNTSSGILSLNS
jgi:hypothetical protein